MTRRLTALFLLVALAGCAAVPRPLGKEVVKSRLVIDSGRFTLTTSDGIELPGRVWHAPTPEAIAIALHGFNDYSAAFETVGPALADQDITVFAYDQRGFGEAPGRTGWAGGGRMLEDLMDMAAAVRSRHPDLPLALIGESMGGAVVLDAVAAPGAVRADRAVLIAPAVWGRSSMPHLAVDLLDWANRWIPGFYFTFQTYIRPSDNIDMLRRLARDPLMIKGARIGTLRGLIGLMETGQREAARLTLPTLILYGGKDQIIPRGPTCRMLASLPDGHQTRVATYPDGHHMLTRDHNGSAAIDDIATFITDPGAALPSGSEAATAWPVPLCGPGSPKGDKG